ncbi:MAG TPA: DUF3800 domain-containing protein [Rugosimonospora sp.]
MEPIVLLCYIDEAGNEQVLDPALPDACPVLVVAGLVVAEAQVKPLAWEFLNIKKKYLPGARVGNSRLLSDLIRTEIKGADLRADIRSTSRRRGRWAIGILEDTLRLLETARCGIAGHVWINREGQGLRTASYALSVAKIAEDFHSQLAAAAAPGIMILDARTKSKNVPNVHTITTRKFRSGGDPLPRLVESPVFGHSDSHIGLQIADLVASAVLFPLACLAYCANLSWNTHCHPNYERIRHRFGWRLQRHLRTAGSQGNSAGASDDPAAKPTPTVMSRGSGAPASPHVA